MGADFLVAIAPYPKDWDAVAARIDQQADQDFLMFAEDFYGWMTDEYTEGEIVEAIKDELRNAVNELRDDHGHSQRRDMTGIVLEGSKAYMISGGMSGGDSPTEAFDMIFMLDWFQITDDDRHKGGE